MKRLVLSITTIIFLLNGLSELGASDNAGAFIEQGIGARAASLGMSYVSIVNDSLATYWNPAGLTQLEGRDLHGSARKAFETDYKSIHLAGPYGRFYWGLGYIGAGVDGIKETQDSLIPGRSEATGNTFGYDAHAIFLSAAVRPLDVFSVGATVKGIQESMYGRRASGIGADLGILITPFETVSLGINAQNILSAQMKWNTPSKNVDTVPLNIKAGVGLRLWDDRLLLTSDINIPKNRTVRISAGVEYWLTEFFPVRIGYAGKKNSRDKQSGLAGLSLGTGLRVRNIRLDFSWSNPDLDVIETVYRFSFGYEFK